jgi:hypothetical protein
MVKRASLEFKMALDFLISVASKRGAGMPFGMRRFETNPFRERTSEKILWKGFATFLLLALLFLNSSVRIRRIRKKSSKKPLTLMVTKGISYFSS